MIQVLSSAPLRSSQHLPIPLIASAIIATLNYGFEESQTWRWPERTVWDAEHFAVPLFGPELRILKIVERCRQVPGDLWR